MPAGEKVSLWRLLRQMQTPEDEFKFLIRNKLVPETAKCKQCDGLLDKIYPINDPGAKFKFFRCPCSNKNKVPVYQDTFLHKANISVKQYVILLYGFCHQLKYDDVRREADIEGPDSKDEEGYHEEKLSDKTIAYWYEVLRLCVGQEMVERDKDKKIGGVDTEVEIRVFHNCNFSPKYIVHTLTCPSGAYISQIQKLRFLG